MVLARDSPPYAAEVVIILVTVNTSSMEISFPSEESCPSL